MGILRKIFGLVKEKGYDKDAVRSFMDNNDRLTFGKACIYFYDSKEIEIAQKGFSEDENGKSLVTNESGSWDKTWLVIGKENICNDPIFIDTYNEELPVFTAIQENNQWEPVELATSLNSFQNIINELDKIHSLNDISEIESKTEAEKEIQLQVIQKENKNLDNWWWESLL